MKSIVLAALFGYATAAEVQEEVEIASGVMHEQQDTHLAQLIVNAVKGTEPRVIPKPRGLSKTDAALIGNTQKTSNLGYTYHWQWVCEYMTWTPTNQFIFDHRTFDPKTMTLHRFGMIGWNKDCFWGMTGVMWIQPLQVNQIVPHATNDWVKSKGLTAVGKR